MTEMQMLALVMSGGVVFLIVAIVVVFLVAKGG